MSGTKRITRRHFIGAGVTVAGASVIAACGSSATPQVVEKIVTQVVEKEVIKEVEVTTVIKEIVKETVVMPTQVVKEQVVVTATPGAEEKSASQRMIIQYGAEGCCKDPICMSHCFANTGLKNALWTGLVGMDKDMNLYPQGAEKWSWDEATMTFTFMLRKGMMWSDGTPITANDWVYSFHRNIMDLDPDFHAKEMEAGRVHAWTSFAHMMCNDIDGVPQLRDKEVTAEQWQEQYGDAITAEDDFTLKIRLWHVVPENLFMGKMAYAGSQVVKQENVESGTPEIGWWENPVTSGPFMVLSHAQDQQWVLVRNPNYWGDPAILDEVTLRVVPDAQTALIAYENGEMDVVQLAEADALEFAKPEHPRNPELMSVPSAVISYMWMMNLPPIDDVLVRRALIRAIDRQATVEAVYRGTAKFSPTYITDFTPGWEMPPNYDEVFLAYEPERAMEELKQSAYYNDIASGKLPIRLLFTQGMTQTSWGRLFEAFNDQWKKNLGIDVKLQQVEFEQQGLLESRWNVGTNGRGLLYSDIDAWVGNVMDMYDPDGSYGRIKTEDQTSTYDVLTLPRMDQEDDARFIQLWREAAAETDQAKRLTMYQEWEYLREKWAIEVPILYSLMFVAAQPWAKDIQITPQYGILFNRGWVARH